MKRVNSPSCYACGIDAMVAFLLQVSGMTSKVLSRFQTGAKAYLGAVKSEAF